MGKQQSVSIDNLEESEIERLIDELDQTEVEDKDLYALRELLRSNNKDIFFKTELNFTQIQGIVKLLTADKIMKAQSEPDEEKSDKMLNSVVWELSDLLMKLLVSKQRKGRGEFLQAVEGTQETKKSGWVDRFLGRGGGI